MNPETEAPPVECPAPPSGETPAVITLAMNQNVPAAKPTRRRRHVPPEKAGLLLIGEAAAALRCSPKTVRKLVKTGRLRAIRLTGGKTDPLRFRLLDVQRFIAECEESHPRRN